LLTYPQPETEAVLSSNQQSGGFRYTTIAWLLWLPCAIAVSWRPLLWQIRYLGSSGPNFYWVLLALIFSVPLVLFFWNDIRKLGAYKYEGWVLIYLPFVVALFYEPKATLAVCCIGAGSFAIGRRALCALGLHTEGPIEEIALSAGAGLGILHLVLFAFGIAGWYFPAVFASLIALALVVCWREVKRLPGLIHRLCADWPSLPGMRGWSGSILSALSFALLVPALMVALAPSVYFDMLRIHLPAVAFNLSQHALRVPPYLPYAYFPQSIETVMTMSSALAGQAGAQLAPLLYVVLALLALFRVGRICGFDGFQCLAGVLAAMSVPAFHWTAAAGKNDLALMLFVLLALLAFLRWKQTGEFNWICLGVFFVAMALGVKHIALFALPPIGLLFSYAAWRQPNRFLSFAKLVGIFVLFGSMWFLRSWLATGNPVFPSGLAAAVSTGTHNQRSWWNVMVERDLRFPWRIHFHGLPYFESVSEYPMGIFLVVFLPMWLGIREIFGTAARATLLFCAAYLFYWLNAIAMVRYAIAPIALLLLFTAALTVRFVRESAPTVKFTVLAAVVFTLIFSICGILINEVNGPQLAYFAKRIKKDEYLRQALMPFEALEKIRAVAGREDRVLSLGSCPLAYAPNPATFDCRMLDVKSLNVILQQVNFDSYQFLVSPSWVVSKLPAGWVTLYSGPAFSVLGNPRGPGPNRPAGESN